MYFKGLKCLSKSKQGESGVKTFQQIRYTLGESHD